MADKDSKGQSSRSQIIVAIIGLAGVISTALLGNWDKLFFNSVSDSSNANVEFQAEQKLTEVKFNVYAQDYQPLEFVEVQFIFDGAPAPRYTDSNGYVSIEISERKDIEVILRKDDFESKRQILNLKADPDRTITIYLKKVTADEPEGDTQRPTLSTQVISDESQEDTQRLTSLSATNPSKKPSFSDGNQLETTSPIQRWEFMGAASTGEPVSVDMSSINKTNETIFFNYKIGNDLIAANTDCDKNKWHADGYGWYSPQSQATQKMMDFVCEF